MLRRLAPKIPEGIRVDVGHPHLSGQIDGRGTRAVANPDRRPIHGDDKFARQTGRDAEAQTLMLFVEQIDRANIRRP